MRFSSSKPGSLFQPKRSVWKGGDGFNVVRSNRRGQQVRYYPLWIRSPKPHPKDILNRNRGNRTPREDAISVPQVSLFLDPVRRQAFIYWKHSKHGGSMRLVFIFGLPATGKLTVGTELSKIVDYKLFHNHLVVDLLLSTFEFGSQPFVELREEFWLSVFDQACRCQLKGLIFTFNPESTVRANFVERTVNVIERNRGRIDFVELVCPLSELKYRLDSPSRLQYRKLSSLSLFEQLHAGGAFDTSYMPKPVLTIDTSLKSPKEAAAEISTALDLI
uniref:Shikimate kinase n=1 Tax=uncultured bacterium Bio5 TaxID=460938 RepID=B2BKB0_9BACT|nr:unknown [uncultured bacterium Bio5]